MNESLVYIKRFMWGSIDQLNEIIRNMGRARTENIRWKFSRSHRHKMHTNHDINPVQFALTWRLNGVLEKNFQSNKVQFSHITHDAT